MSKAEGVEELSTSDNQYMYTRISLIPCTYLIAIALAFFVNIQAAAIFPIIIVPAMILLAKVFDSKKTKENINL